MDTAISLKSARRRLLPLLALPLAACQSSLEVHLAVSSPPEELERLELALTAVELRDEGGGSVRLEVDERRSVDWLANGPDELRRLLSESDVPERRYTGLRLQFAEEGGEAQFEDGSEVPVVLADTQAFLPLNLALEREEEGRAEVVLDLHFSLADRRQALGQLTLRPAGTATDADASAALSGAVDAEFARRDGCDTDRGYAFYLYAGERTVVNDFRRGDTGAPLRSAWLQDSAGDDFQYRFISLPAGRYTLAYTCQADLDDPVSDDAVVFRDLTVLELRAGRETRRDF